MSQQQDQNEVIPSRWEVELEFVQSLANLQYLNFLAQNNFLQDDKFLAYLEYLEYWRQPEYAKHLIYPNCLHILTLLQNKDFRDQILRQDIVGVIMNDMNERWREDLTNEAAAPVVPSAEPANAAELPKSGTESERQENEKDDTPGLEIVAPGAGNNDVK